MPLCEIGFNFGSGYAGLGLNKPTRILILSAFIGVFGGSTAVSRFNLPQPSNLKDPPWQLPRQSVKKLYIRLKPSLLEHPQAISNFCVTKLYTYTKPQPELVCALFSGWCKETLHLRSTFWVFCSCLVLPTQNIHFYISAFLFRLNPVRTGRISETPLQQGFAAIYKKMRLAAHLAAKYQLCRSSSI